jgi:hypothetical protein
MADMNSAEVARKHEIGILKMLHTSILRASEERMK